MTDDAELVRLALVGRSAPIKLRELTEACGFSERRTTEAAVQELALAGYPIVTSGDGVRMSGDPAEVRAAADRLDARLVHQYERVRALRATADRMESGPLTLGLTA